MGSVWVGHHARLDTEVAVKLLAKVVHGDPRIEKRFEREAALLAKVRSPHVVSVLDAGTSPELGPYLVMELLEGHDLSSELETRGVLDPNEVETLLDQVALGLTKAHGAGLVHRDLKPANLFLCTDMGTTPFVKIVDFGVALAPGEDSRLTQTGYAIGTKSTMSPEQAAGREVDARSDLYSLALVVFRSLTGHSAISRASLDALGMAAYRAERPRPSSLRPELPEAVDAWFEKATAFSPDERFQDARSLADAFREACHGSPEKKPLEADRNDAPASATGTVEEPSFEEPDDPVGAGTASASVVIEANEPSLPEAVHSPPSPPEAVAVPEVAAPREPSDTRATATRELGPESAEPARRSSWTRSLLGGVAALTFVAAGLYARTRTGDDATSSASSPASGSLASSSIDAASAAPAAELHLSLLMDVSGGNRRRGADLERAARAAVEAIDAEGGVRSKKLVLRTFDDEGAVGPFLRTRGEEAMKASDVHALLGPLLSTQAHEVGPLAAKMGTLSVSPSATADALSTGDARSTFVGLSPADSRQAAALAKVMRAPSWSSKLRACTRAGIVATSDAHGAPFATALEAALATAPRVPSRVITIEPEPRRTYDDVVAPLLRDKPDCVVLVLSPKLGARVLASLSTKDRKAIRVLAGDTLASIDFVEYARGDVENAALPSAAEGVEGVAVATAAADRPERAAFERAFRTHAGRAPEEPFAAQAFDATVLLALALEAVGPEATATQLREAMVRISRGKNGYGPSELGRLLRAVARGEDAGYEGASGDIDLSEDGRVTGAFERFTIHAGKVERAGLVK
jgi:serine/threonine-protein kinase